MNFIRTSLRIKVIVSILLVAVPLVFATFALYQFSSNALFDSAVTKSKDTLENKSDELAEIFKDASNHLLIAAENPALRLYYEYPAEKDRWLQEQHKALKYIRSKFEMLDEACVIDSTGQEASRIVFDEIAPQEDLSSEEEGASFFNPTFALEPGQVYQSEPYLSPDTERWVAASTTPVADSKGNKVALLHFEVNLDHFRQMLKRGLDDKEFVFLINDKKELVLDTRSEPNYKAKFKDAESEFKQADSDDDFINNMLTGSSDRPTYTNIDGESYYIVYSPMKFSEGNVNKWSMGYAIPSEKFFSGFSTSKYLLILSILALILAVILANVVGNGIVAPIRGLLGVVSSVASGDLTQQIEVSRKDELGHLSESFNKMVDSMKIMLKQISKLTKELSSSAGELSAASEQINASSEQSSATISDIAAGITEQNMNIEDVAGTLDNIAVEMEKITSQTNNQSSKSDEISAQVENLFAVVSDVNERSKDVSSAIEQSKKTALNGGEAVSQTIAEMEIIRDVVLSSADKIKAFGEKSIQVGEITKVINDISDQTNLLALNAAIEAARAGEHGKGFAVVADEVRKLAERSSKAVNEIAELIASVQKGSAETVQAMEKGTTEVESGVKLAKDAGGALSEILESVDAVSQHMTSVSNSAVKMEEVARKVYAIVNEIVELIEQTNESTIEVAKSSHSASEDIANVVSISQTNAAATQEIAATSEEQSAAITRVAGWTEKLAIMAQDLEQLIVQFKIGDEQDSIKSNLDAEDTIIPLSRRLGLKETRTSTHKTNKQ